MSDIIDAVATLVTAYVLLLQIFFSAKIRESHQRNQFQNRLTFDLKHKSF